jgi:hypothetical protein
MASTETPAANPNPSTTTAAAVPKRIVNAQTVCNEKNEKGKLCNGHLKQLRTAGEPAEIHLRGDDVLFNAKNPLTGQADTFAIPINKVGLSKLSYQLCWAAGGIPGH